MKHEITPEIQKALEIIEHGTVTLVSRDELIKKLQKGKPLRVKFGADPTAPDLHLGHAVVLSKLRQFQDLGHEIIFLIGDYTTRIGDPSGRSKTRPPLSPEDIEKNAKTYFEQVVKVLDPKKTIVRYNSEWLSKLSFADVIKLCGKVTLAQIIEREDFSKRVAEKAPIGLHELLYPLMQGFDSVELKADVELGGTDQTFNLLMGRTLQEQWNIEPQVVLTTPLLEGLDGVQKMSKSLGNYIGLWEPAQEAYGKLMSISDELMWRYYLLLCNKTEKEIAFMKHDVTTEKSHPMVLKKAMAHMIIARFWSPSDADMAQKNFESLFQRQDYSAAQEVKLPSSTTNPLWIVDLLKALGAIKTSSEAKRLIESSSVDIDGSVITDFKAMISWQAGMVIKVGKHRIYRLE
jgi:tyrosyl-tRNA synthetase